VGAVEDRSLVVAATVPGPGDAARSAWLSAAFDVDADGFLVRRSG
jgi:hypothetical protein